MRRLQQQHIWLIFSNSVIVYKLLFFVLFFNAAFINQKYFYLFQCYILVLY